MTNGPLLGKIVRFAIPLALSGILQLLFNAADIVVVGQFVGPTALAAVGSTSAVINLIVNLFMGFSVGANVLAAQYYGAGRLNRVRDVVDTVYTFFTWAVVPITALALLIAKPLLELMRVQEDAMGDAYLYLLILSAGLIGTIGYNINAGILRGVGRPCCFWGSRR